MNDDAIAELESVLRKTHPGKRIRPATLLRYRIVCREAADLLRKPRDLAIAINTTPPLSAVACADPEPCDGGTPIILRRRFLGEERRRALLDLNNLVWTLEPEMLITVIGALRQFGVTLLHGVGDANLPYQVDRDVLDKLRSTLDSLEIAPGGTSADGIILDRAEEMGAMIVSNDMFRDWRRTSPWRRRNIHRLRVPVVRDDRESDRFSFGDVAIELRRIPPQRSNDILH